MIEQIKLKQLQYGFNKLTEANMFYILGLVEGLKYAQYTDNEKLLVKLLSNSHDVNSPAKNITGDSL